LESSSPVAGPAWTDSGRRREERPLKHRARGETRVVRCPPALTALLHAHLETFGNGADGLLFRGVRGGEMSESTYCRVWRARPASLRSRPMRSVAPWRAGPTTSGTPPSRRGSTPVYPPHRSQRGPGTASLSCSRATPSVSSARRTPPAAGLTPCSAGRRETLARIWHRRPAPMGFSRTPPDNERSQEHCISAGHSPSSRVPPVGLEPTLEPF
jgi:hypothetical protein